MVSVAVLVATAGHVACAAVVPFGVPFGGDGYNAVGKNKAVVQVKS